MKKKINKKYILVVLLLVAVTTGFIVYSRSRSEDFEPQYFTPPEPRIITMTLDLNKKGFPYLDDERCFKEVEDISFETIFNSISYYLSNCADLSYIDFKVLEDENCMTDEDSCTWIVGSIIEVKCLEIDMEKFEKYGFEEKSF